MKTEFEYQGPPGMIDFDLTLANITPIGEPLKPGQKVTIEDEYLAERLRMNGNWKEVTKKKKGGD